VAHLLAYGLQQNRLTEEGSLEVERSVFTAVFRSGQMSAELKALTGALEAAHIPFIPLKGSVIKNYYPEPWMRTSCDIDVLVRREDLDKAVSYLESNLGYQCGQKFTHDVSLFTKNGCHIELHYSLMEDEPIKSSPAVLNNVWESASKRDGYEYWHELSDEVFYFYHVAHMAKHFENGGCGIRPFLDIDILNRRIDFDEKKRMSLLKKGDLQVFAIQARILSNVWFGDAQHTGVTEQMEAFILAGGVYGTTENHVAVQQQKKGGKIRYALSKVWLPYDLIKFYYPVLGRHKIFTPIMQIRRWLRLIFGGHLKRSVKELNYNSGISRDKAQHTKALLKSLDL
jgi:hypothetical protein